MFDQIKNFVRRAINTMLGKNIIEDKLKVQTAITTEQQK